MALCMRFEVTMMLPVWCFSDDLVKQLGLFLIIDDLGLTGFNQGAA